jgi:hypothetical protein
MELSLFTEQEKEYINNAYETGTLDTIDKVKKIIDNLENPYPEDIFPELTRIDLEYVNHVFNKSYLKLDRVSASLMRKARKNLIEEIKQKLGEK